MITFPQTNSLSCLTYISSSNLGCIYAILKAILKSIIIKSITSFSSSLIIFPLVENIIIKL